MESRNIKHTKITDKIRVSTALIVYAHELYPYIQYETFIFSDDANCKTKLIIHGTSTGVQSENENIIEYSIKAHDNIVNNLKAHHIS